MRTKFLFSTLFLLATLGLSAQNITDAGNFLIGTSIGFSTASSETEISGQGESIQTQSTEFLQFNIAPKIGYFVTNNWGIGIALDYTLSQVEEPINVLDPNTEYNISYDSDLLFGPFTRVYLPMGEDKAFFLEGTLGFGSSRNEIDLDGGQQTISNNVLTVGVGPGFTIFSNDGIGIEAIAKYNWARANANVDVQGIKNETTNITNALDFSIGFQVYFSRLARASTNDSQPASAPRTRSNGFYGTY